MTLTYALKDSQVMIARNVRRSLRDPEAFFTALMLPIILMLLFVYVFGGAINSRGKYVDYVVPGLIVLCAGFGAGTTAVAVATDMTNGIVDRFRSMPIAGSSVLIGHVVASLARNLVATTLVIAVGLLVGWRPTGSALDWVAAAAMIVLLILALSWLAAGVGLLAPPRRRPARSRWCSCSCRTSAPRSSPHTRCPPCCAPSPSASRSRRSSRQCADCGWDTHRPARARPRGGRRHRLVHLSCCPRQRGRITPVPTPHSRLNDLTLEALTALHVHR